jgi:murein DD-endopeptidase MepM/ murein hydrolase activator NlpD
LADASGTSSVPEVSGAADGARVHHTGAEACLVRDPEDGACYPSADAADQAWLARSGTQVPAAYLASMEAGSDDDEGEDVEEEESEDGGIQAPVDSLLPNGRAVPTLEEIQSPAKRSFWKSLARTVKGLVVRKTDSRPVSIPEGQLSALFASDFPLPLESFSTEKLRDSFNAPRGRHRRHHAIDLPAPRGTPVVAVVDGTVERLGRDRRGGKVCYLRDSSNRFTFYYAHLSRHEKGLKAGDRVVRGQRLGEVGSTGHASGPHLHFAIFCEPQEEATWGAFVVNPYLIFAGGRI